MSLTPFYRLQLQKELQTRVGRNPHYSVRSFAQSLKVGPSALSQILNGKRRISLKVMERLIQGLELSELDRSHFRQSVVEEKKKLGTRKINRALLSLAKESTSGNSREKKPSREIGQNEFQVISEWYHSAIRELTCKPDFRADSRWIAGKLSISRVEAKLALDRLTQLNLISNESGKWRKTDRSVDTRDKTKTTEGHRRRQRQLIERSIQSLERDPIDERNHSTITFCTSAAKIAEAKRRIERFTWELVEFLEDGPSDRLYAISAQLFPLERKDPSA